MFMNVMTITVFATLFFTITQVKAVNSSVLFEDPKSAALSKKTTAIAAQVKILEYDTDKPLIRDVYYRNLDELVKTIRANDYAVALRGHADSRGKYKYNWVLSDKRAISVKDYLVSKGVKENRIVTTPFGSSMPIATNSTAAGRQKNRRVEIELKKIN